MAAGQTPPGARPSRGGEGLSAGSGQVSEAATRVGRARRSVTDVPDEWPSPASAGTEPGLQTI